MYRKIPLLVREFKFKLVYLNREIHKYYKNIVIQVSASCLWQYIPAYKN